LSGIVNRDSARLYLLNVFETWSYNKTDEMWRDIYRTRGNVQFDSIATIAALIEKFRPFINGAVTYDPQQTWSNFNGQGPFQWQGEYAALLGGLTNRLPVSPSAAAGFGLTIADSILVIDPFDGDSAVWVTGRFELPAHPWNNVALTTENRYLTLLDWGTRYLLPRCNPRKFHIREITDRAIQERMFQVDLAGLDDLKLDQMPAARADILEKVLTFLHSKNPNSLFHIYGWIRPEPMVQWFMYFGASFHETILGNLSWHSTFPVVQQPLIAPAHRIPDTSSVRNKYYLVFIGSEGDAANWQFSFQSGAWLSPVRGSIPVTWGWNLQLFEECPFVAQYYYDTGTANDGFISVTAPMGYAYPDLWQTDVWNDGVSSSSRYMRKYDVANIYGYKHYEGNGVSVFRGKQISNSFNFTRYGQYLKGINAQLTFLFDPLLPLQIPMTNYGSLMINHCNDGSFYGDASNIITMANRILNTIKGKPKPYFLLAGYQRLRQDDFGIRIDPSTADISLSRLQQLIQLMQFDSLSGKDIEVVTVERFSKLLRQHMGLTNVELVLQSRSVIALHQNYPNPFNPVTTIRYELHTVDKTIPVSIQIYNILGEHIETVYEGDQTAGIHTAVFNGAGYPGGIYFCRILSGVTAETKKMVLIK
jgi:hypothetical protein